MNIKEQYKEFVNEFTEEEMLQQFLFSDDS